MGARVMLRALLRLMLHVQDAVEIKWDILDKVGHPMKKDEGGLRL